MVPFRRRLPHSISPLEGSGFEISVPRYPRWSCVFPRPAVRAERRLCPEIGVRNGLAAGENWILVIVIERTSSDRGSRRSVGLSYGLAMIAISAILQVLCFNWCSWFSRRSRRPL